MTDPAFVLECLDTVDSTSSELLRRLDAGAAPGLALMARRQTGGRGRLGRMWQTVDGNLFLSASMAVNGLRQPGHWSLLAAVALRDALAALAPAVPVRLKWPNDLMCNGHKLAGILVDAVAHPDGAVLVFGFGVNVAGAPAGLGRPVTSLRELGAPTEAAALAAALLSSLSAWAARYRQSGFAPVQAAWLAAGPQPGERLSVHSGTTQIEGGFAGIGLNGALLLDGPDGRVTVAAGEVLA